MFSFVNQKTSKFFERLIYLRKSAGFTQKKMAKLLDIAEQTMNNYESGKRSPDVVFVQKIVELTNCDPGWLLTGQGQMEAGEGGKKKKLSPQEEKKEKYFQNLYKRVRRVLTYSNDETRKKILGEIHDAELTLNGLDIPESGE